VSLPAAPTIRLELLEDLSPASDGGFLRLVRRRYRAHYADGRISRSFVYDAVDRSALDAVVIAAHFERQGIHQVYLRTAVRPPLLLRAAHPVSEPPNAALWELPAGLVDLHERETWEGVRRAAQRELDEELGFKLEPERLEALGLSVFPAPGFIGERHFFFCVRVDPGARNEPTLDGSVLEQDGLVLAMPLSEALSLCREGEILDSKTELGLRRLQERLA